jgi:hypothetical protein
MKSLIHSINLILRFYIDGFRNMSVWGRRVWLLIAIKLFIIFAILKLFFFSDFLEKKFSNRDQRSEYVRNQIINPPNKND